MNPTNDETLATGDETERLFVARQPIFNADRSLYGYEILFRSGYKNCFDPSVDQNYASGRALTDTYMTFGIGELTGDRRAFINFTQKHLEEEAPLIFPRGHLVIEVLESVEPNEKLVSALRSLKAAGFTIALDDFVYAPKFDPLIELADIIKIDFMVTGKVARARIVRQLGDGRLKFLAEKVETNEIFEEALNAGYTLFQGYFFAKPQVMQTADIPVVKLNYLEIVREVNRPELDFSKIEALVRRDLALSYKFLRFLNSAHFGFEREITSIREALGVLGQKGARTWLSLVALTSLGDDKPRELVTTALVRALFLERLGSMAGMGDRTGELFLVGLFSVIDAILDRPMETIVADLPLAPEVKAALTGKQNGLREMYRIMESYEKGEWGELTEECSKLHVSEGPLPAIYRKALTEAAAIENEFAK